MGIRKLTPEEIEERAMTLAGLELRYEELKELQADANRHTRETLADLREQIVKLSTEVDAGEIVESDQLEIVPGPKPVEAS